MMIYIRSINLVTKKKFYFKFKNSKEIKMYDIERCQGIIEWNMKYRKIIRKRFPRYISNAFFIDCYNQNKSIYQTSDSDIILCYYASFTFVSINFFL